MVLFEEQGYGGVTMDAVAAGVGVTKPLLYNYFGNKEQLFLACLGETGDALEIRLRQAVAGARHPGDALKDALRAFATFVEAEPGAWQLLYDGTLPTTGPIADAIAGYRERLTALVAAEVLALGGPTTPLEAEALASGFLAASEAMGRWWLRTRGLPAASVADLLIDTLEPGLARRALHPSKESHA